MVSATASTAPIHHPDLSKPPNKSEEILAEEGEGRVAV
jgi:hypothetical protein